MINRNYHTHTYLCKHALGDASDYLERCLKLNYLTLGISDHGPLPDEISRKITSRRMNFQEYVEIYLPMLKDAKNKYADKIEVLGGLEIEYFAGYDEYYQKFLNDLDYLILGQHYLKKEEELINIYGHLSKDDLDLYDKTISLALDTKYFKILAHPDIFTWRIDKWTDQCEEVASNIIDAAIKNNVLLEVNANGIRNAIQQKRLLNYQGKVNYPYPRYEFFMLAKKKQALVIINDDAHAPNRISDQYTKLAYNFARDLNLNIVDKLDLK